MENPVLGAFIYYNLEGEGGGVGWQNTAKYFISPPPSVISKKIIIIIIIIIIKMK